MSYKEYFSIEKRIKATGVKYESDKELRRDMIRQFTNGRKTGLTELNDWEYRELIKWLNMKFPAQQTPKYDPNDPRQKMRLKIIALFRQMGYSKDGKADMSRIQKWCKTRGKFKKKLNDHSSHELVELVTQAESYYQSYIKTK